MRGNVVDMAAGIVIGAAFGKIVSFFVSDVLMPPLGLAFGGMDFSGLFINPDSGSYPTLAAAKAAGAPTLNYGLFINTLIELIIIAFALFMAIKAMNRLKKEEAPANAAGDEKCPECLSEIPLAAKRCMYCASAVSSR